MNNSAPPARILVCLHQFFPEFSAGTEVLALSTAKSLRALGYMVEIVTCTLTDAANVTMDRYNFQGFNVHRISIPYRRQHRSADAALEEYDNQHVGPAFAAILETYQPDLVHFFHLKNLTLSSLEQCFARTVPTVFTPTDYWLTCRTCQLLKNWGEPYCNGPDKQAGNCLKHIIVNSNHRVLAPLASALPSKLFSLASGCLTTLPVTRSLKASRLPAHLKSRKGRIAGALARVDLILPPTRSIENMLRASDIADENIQPLRYAIEPPSVSRDLTASTPRERPFTVAFIGTLVEHKGCHVLLNALKLAPEHRMVVNIYGDPSHYPKYVSQLKLEAADDDRVQFCGTFASEDIGKVLASIDLLIIPSTWRENAPLVLLNAIASGTPVIASDVSGITEYLNQGDDVTLFPPGDSRSLARGLVAACGRGARSNNSSGSRRVAGSSLETYANALDDAYTRLIKRPHNKMEKT